MIQIDNVYKYYSNKNQRIPILNNVSMEIKTGEDIGILGRNGAGKSTLFRLIAGSEPPDRGSILRSSSVSWPLGFSGGFHGSLTGRENIRFVSRIYAQNPKTIFEFVADFSELGKYIDMPIRSYSSGMKARLAFGLSMAINFDFYLIDEVIAVGDSAFKKKCKAVLAEKRKKATIILISHSNDLLQDFCQAGAVLDRGKLTKYQTIEEAIFVHELNQSILTKP